MRPDFTNHTTLHPLNCALKLVLIYRPHPVHHYPLQRHSHLPAQLTVSLGSRRAISCGTGHFLSLPCVFLSDRLAALVCLCLSVCLCVSVAKEVATAATGVLLPPGPRPVRVHHNKPFPRRHSYMTCSISVRGIVWACQLQPAGPSACPGTGPDLSRAGHFCPNLSQICPEPVTSAPNLSQICPGPVQTFPGLVPDLPQIFPGPVPPPVPGLSQTFPKPTLELSTCACSKPVHGLPQTFRGLAPHLSKTCS